MKSLSICLESILDDDDTFFDPENDKKDIENWIKTNYNVTGRLTVKNDFVVDCSGDVEVKNRSIISLTNGLFRWGYVGKRFYCNGCKNIKTLEGAPKEVRKDFSCGGCENLTSLEGAPEKVGGGFDCSFCNKLESLKGAPNEVGGEIYCYFCKKLKITDSDREKYKIEDWK